MDQQQIDELRKQVFAQYDTTGEKLQAITAEWADRYEGFTTITLEQSLMIRAQILETLIKINVDAAAAAAAKKAGDEASAAAGNHTSN